MAVFPLKVCVQMPPFYKDTSHTALRPILLQYDIILMNNYLS